MTVLRTQGIESVSVTAVNAAFTTFDVPRPETSPKEPAYAENSDHTIAPPALREFEAGNCVVSLGANLHASDVWLDKVEVVKLLPTPQKGVASAASALYPTGAPSDASLVRVLVDRNNANDLATNSPAVYDFFGLNRGGDDTQTRSFPGITLESGEYLRITLGNTSGGNLTDNVTATYKLGFNQQDTGKP